MAIAAAVVLAVVIIAIILLAAAGYDINEKCKPSEECKSALFLDAKISKKKKAR